MTAYESYQLASPGSRACCLLSKWYGWDWLGIPNVLEPERSTYLHLYAGTVPFTRSLLTYDAVGLIYTCAGGFIDFGHLRDVADLTRFYHDGISLARVAGSRFTRPHKEYFGRVELLSDVPADRVIDVARSIAYAESVFHEILTYWMTGVGKHQSAFSPEDLPSNFLGAYVAGLALRSEYLVAPDQMPDRDTRVTDQIEALLTRLGPVSKANSEAALDAVEGTWFSGAFNDNDYLKRRNLSRWPVEPWLVNGVLACDASTAQFPAMGEPSFAIPDGTEDYYTVSYSVPEEARGPGKIDAATVTLDDFDALIGDIADHAETNDGPDFGTPQPVGTIGGPP